MKKTITLFFLLALGLFQFCTSPEASGETKAQEEKQVIEETENSSLERSELAILMRDLYNTTKAYGKEDLAAGKPFSKALYDKYLKITTATPTDSNNTGEAFEAFGNSFLASLEVLTHPENVNQDNYNNMVSNCLACHSQHCPGPMLVIRKMKAKAPQE